MKEPKMAKEVSKKKAIKKPVSSVRTQTKINPAVSSGLRKRVAPQKSTPNFTLAELTASVTTKPKVKKRSSTLVLPTTVPEIKTVATGLVINYRFASVTQVIGIGLALFGFCFAVVFGSGILPPHSQPAQVVESVATSSAIAVVESSGEQIHCALGFILVDTKCVNPKPLLKFSVPGDHARLRDSVVVQATVEHATRVKLSVYSKDAASKFELGVMNKVSNTNFTLDWPTNSFSDGTYYLLATVENAFGAYDTGDTVHPLIVINNPPIVSTTSLTSSSALPVSVVSTTTITPVFTTNTHESATQVNFTIKAGNAKSVVLYMRSTTSLEFAPIGTAYRNSDTEWRYSWLLDTIDIGEYNVVAQVERADSSIVRSPVITIKRIAQSVVSKSAVATDTPLTVASSSSTSTATLPVTPIITAVLTPASPLRGISRFKIQVANASDVTVAIQNSNNLVKTVLGKANKVEANVWIVTFDSTKVPDGEYALFTTVTTSYGTTDTRIQTFLIKNRTETLPTPDEAKKIAVLEDVVKLLPASEGIQLRITRKSTSTASVVVSSSTLNSVIGEVDAIIESELQKLTTALRSGDSIKVSAIKANIESLTKQKVYQATGDASDSALAEKAKLHVSNIIAQIQSNVVTIDKIVADRTGENASKDSDHDGIPDFDEVTIYKTNPFVADTDNDGFIDGAEVMSGYDPLNAKAETLVNYESPKVAGVEQKDLLAVSSVSTVTAIPDTATTTAGTTEIKRPVALISGKAPANSFVTLYIFSTPIVVTIKTDADGGWNYHFDKELENGTHEVYVGVTDNAGKIVAKSAPFSFIKTAEAYSVQKEVADAVATPVPPTEHNLLSSRIMYVLAGLTILIIGLLLLFIGMRFDSRRRIVENIVA